MFEEARQLIDEYEKTYPPSPVMYSECRIDQNGSTTSFFSRLLAAMLSGARTQQHPALSQQLYDRMKSLFPDQKPNLFAASVLLSNTYSSVGDVQQAQEVRIDRLQRLGNNNMKLGLSWTEVNGELVVNITDDQVVRDESHDVFAFQKFKAHDPSHLKSPKMIAGVERLSHDLKEHGHEFDGSWVTRPLQEGESIESVLCGHSEKLAIVFNLIQDPRPSVIQITKNLRVCGDCRMYREIR